MTIPIPGLDQLSDDAIFNFCSQIVLPAWLVLLLAPRWKMRKTIVYATILVNCAVYTATFAASMGSNEDSFSKTYTEMGTLDGVIKLFTNDDVIVPAWVHYLAFDLTVGNYLVEKNLADPAGLHQLLMAPVLFFTLMAGPIGVLTYTAMRAFTGLFVSHHALKTSGTTFNVMPIPIPGLDHISDATIFNFCSNIIILPAWLVLLLAPKWKMRQALVYATVLFNCMIYASYFVTWVNSNDDGLFKTFMDLGDLDGVTKHLTSNSDVILPAWLHYLVLDLTAGNYIVEKNAADPDGLSQLLMAPVLFLSLMAGPLGVLMYTTIRISTRLFANRPHAVKTS